VPRACLLVFLVHVGVQGLVLTRVPEDWIRPHARFEVTAVAMSLYERGTFADPYCLPTGPTAHMPPFHPALMAGIYVLLGPTLAAGYATWLFLIACYGAMYGMLPWLGERLGLGPRPGLVAGLVGALLPRLPGYVEAPAAVAIGLMMIAFLRRWENGRATDGGSLALGLAIGLSFLVSPSLLPVPLGLLAFELAWVRQPRRGRRAALVLVGMALACAPWTIRNQRALGGLFFVRSNFGLELRMGNHEGAGANLDLSDRNGTLRHPRTNVEEARKVQQRGELEYMRAAGREATGWIRSNPAEFARLTGLRVAQFWLGPIGDRPIASATTLLTLLAAVGAWRVLPTMSGPRRAALLIPLATYPLVYYVVGYEPRYRQPLDALLLLLAAAALVRVTSRPCDSRPPLSS
jgi:4-amino-4-deoxy-L-arabinose transferase-like glycosyltransferase